MQKKQMNNNNEKQVQRLREIGRKRKIGDNELVCEKLGIIRVHCIFTMVTK